MAQLSQAQPPREKVSWKDRWIAMMVILPPVIYLVVLYLLPAMIMFAYSFWKINQNYLLDPVWNLGQYQYFFSQSSYLTILGRSFQMALANTLITLVLAYPLAYFLSFVVSARWKNLLLVLLMASAWTSFLIRIYSWILILGGNGLINYVLLSLGLINDGLPLLYNRGSLLLGLAYAYLPFMVLPIYASLEKIPHNLGEAAQALGAAPARAFLRVTLPLSFPGVLAGVMITFIPTLGEYVAPALLGGSAGYQYGNLIAEQFGIFDWPLGAAMASILLACVLALVLVFSRLVRLEDIFS